MAEFSATDQPFQYGEAFRAPVRPAVGAAAVRPGGAAQRSLTGLEPGSENDETGLHVPLGGAGVGAAAVGLGDQGLGLVAGEVGNGHPELDVQGETAFGVLGQGDQGGDGGLAGVIFSIRATEWRALSKQAA